jgi:hypothetical protein
MGREIGTQVKGGYQLSPSYVGPSGYRQNQGNRCANNSSSSYHTSASFSFLIIAAQPKVSGSFSKLLGRVRGAGFASNSARLE